MPLFKHGKKNKLSEFISDRFWDSQSRLCLKRKVLYEFPPKCFKTTERHSLAVCGSLCWEKQFLLIFIPFYWFDQKYLFNQIQIFLRICPLSNMVRKTNFLSISVLVFAKSLLCLKRKVLYEFPPKCFKTTEMHSLTVCGSYWVEKQFLLIFVPFYWFDQNNCLNKSKFSSRFAPFKHGKKKISNYFSALFWDYNFYV